MTRRQIFAVVSPMTDWPKVSHFSAQISDEGNLQNDQRLSWPRVLVINENVGAGFTLNRIAVDGSICGDTWHLSLEEAKEQAEFEYGIELNAWDTIPENIVDPTAFALSKALKG